jgi:hypothetical protein
LDNDLGVDLLVNELFSFSKEFTSEYCYSGGSVTDFLVLSLGNVNENFGGRVVNMN